MLAPTEPSALHLVTEPDPQRLLSQLNSELNRYLYVTDFDPTLVSLATAVSKELDADPLWVMLVQSSGSGKTENIRLTHGIADARLKNFTRAGLMTLQRIGSRRLPKGILVDLLGGGLKVAYLTITDFSALLEARQGGGGEISELFNALRDIYDGEYRRDLDGESIQWAGRITLLAACTPAIDNFTTHADALGTRWVYFRIDEHALDTKLKIAQMSETRESIDDYRDAAQATATQIITQARARVNDVKLPEEFSTLIQYASVLAGYGRANVPRDWRGEVSGMPDAEDPGRLVGQLKSLALSLLAMDVNPEVALRIARRAALSSMPVAMLETLKAIAGTDDELSARSLTPRKVASMTGIHRRLTGRSLENWEMIGIMEVEIKDLDFTAEAESTGKRKNYSISPDMRELVDTALGIKRTSLETSFEREEEV